MIKIISVVKRRADMEVDAFQNYWLNVHADIVLRVPGIRRYVQSHTLIAGYRKGEPAADGIAELWLDEKRVRQRFGKRREQHEGDRRHLAQEPPQGIETLKVVEP